MNYADIIIGIISTVAAIIAACYAYKAYLAGKSPKLVIETPFNSSLQIRNIGTEIAKNIKETTGMFRDVPIELWNFNGPIDYLRVKSPGIFRQIDFNDSKLIKPQEAVVVRFEYENSDGDKFFSEIRVECGVFIQQLYFKTTALVNSGKI